MVFQRTRFLENCHRNIRWSRVTAPAYLESSKGLGFVGLTDGVGLQCKELQLVPHARSMVVPVLMHALPVIVA